MRKKENTSNKLYHKSSKKAKPKNENDKVQDTLSPTQKRELRKQKALESLPINDLVSHLQPKQGSNFTCPLCKKPDHLTLDKNDNLFSCKNCKKKGNSINLVMWAKKLSYWQAIYYLEDLATKKKTDTNQEQQPTPSPQQSKPSTSRSKRIPEEIIERIKREIDLVELVRVSGVKLKKIGQDFHGKCPFHQDDKPSLVITPAKNLYHCFGECDQGGSVIDWTMQSQRVEFREAVDILLQQNPNLATIEPTSQPKPQTTIPKKTSENPAITYQSLLKRTIDYYHKTLKRTPKALEYLEKRGILNEEAIEHFQIGFADRSLGKAIAEKSPKERSEIREQLMEIGIFRKSGHHHFAGSIVFPIRDENGNITEIYGRKITPNLRKGTANHTYLPGPHRGIFNRECLKSQEVIICEAIIDALSFWVHGYKNVTATYGANGFPDELLDALVNHKVQRVYLAYDNDAPGNKAALKAAEKLATKGISCLQIVFPFSNDANDLILQPDFTKETMQLLIDNAQPIAQHFLPLAAKKEAAKGEEIATNEIAGNQATASPIAAKEEAAKRENSAAQSPVPSQSPISTTSLAAKENQAAKGKNHIDLPKVDIPMRREGEDIFFSMGNRLYRVRGLERNNSYDYMRVNIRVSVDDRYHIDSLDLFPNKYRHGFVRAAAAELKIDYEIIKRDVGLILLKLEELQRRQIEEKLDDKPKIVITTKERQEAEEWLRKPGIAERIIRDIALCGLVGEDLNILIGYLAAISRKLDEPLAIIIQSSSSAGKTSLMEKILATIPEEDRIQYTAMSAQSLFYMAGRNLQHKTLAISEEEGAERATYALKIMQSEKSLKIASTGKDPKSGKLVTNEYYVEGPIQIILTTTAIEIDEELRNRCLILTVNEGRDQTKAILAAQRQKETLEGMLEGQQQEKILKLHQNIQRIIRPLMVVNPYATQLTFLDNRLTARRDHVKYLILIRAIALLHQYQREVREINHQGEIIEYIEVMPEDVLLANKIANHVLGTSLDDMAPQTRKFLNLIWQMVKETCEKESIEPSEYRFNQRQVREYTGWGHTQTKTHLRRLVELEYLLVSRSNRGERFSYELLYQGEGKDGSSFLMGLVQPEKLIKNYKNKL